MELIQNTNEYKNWFDELKSEIQNSQIKAAIAVNRTLLDLYWKMGKSISEKLRINNWGSSVIDNLSIDLKRHFPNQQGFSRSNLFSIRKWYEFYSNSGLELEFVQQLVGQIPWGHNIVIITKSSSIDEAVFYINKTVENNWSRSILIHQIELDLYARSGKAITNFKHTLPLPHSELANEILKDPYKFDFLTLTEKAIEKDIE